MSQRRFGPTLGAGVVVEEQEAEKILEAAPLGVTCYAGVLERGAPGVLISVFSNKQALKKVGSYTANSLVPDAIQDFWSHGNGAGELHLVRVTDGTERPAILYLYDRSTSGARVAKVSAKNGGRWGSRMQSLVGEFTDLTGTTMETGITMLVDEWKGAKLYLEGITNKSYDVASNSGTGIITIQPTAGAGLDVDYDATSSTDTHFRLVLSRDTSKEMTVEIGDGVQDAVSLFSLKVYVNGAFIKSYDNLSMDPASVYYAPRVINDDAGNDEIVFEDLNTPNTPNPARRPSNYWSKAANVASKVLTTTLGRVEVTDGTPDQQPAVTFGATTDAMMFSDRLEVTMTSATAFTVKSLDLGAGLAVGSGTIGTPCTPTVNVLPPFTLANGGTVLATGNKVVIHYIPFTPNALTGALLYPDPVNAPLRAFRIVSNTHKTVAINAGDLTGELDVGDSFRIIWRQPLGGSGLAGGYDGVAGLTDDDFIQVLDIDSSPFRRLLTENKGLVKLALPGKTATVVQKAGLALAEAMNWQFRVEIPDDVVDESGAVDYINNTIGRSDMGVVTFPSYADVGNPEKPGQLKRISLTGAIHGLEALVAKNYEGYHKAAAGTDIKLTRVLALPANDLNEEVLNPQGICIAKKNKGNYVLWGDRTIALDPAWKWKHQREQMSHYENRLREGFDWVVFAINDPAQQSPLITTLREFFRPEHQKKALRGATFEKACRIKLDNEINTDATRANGDLNAEITLRLADTVERFIMRIGKAGIFDQLA